MLVAQGGCESESAESVARAHVSAAREGVAAALSIQNESLTLYVCGSGSTLATHTRWFFSLPFEDKESFEGQADGWTVAGDREGDSFRATLTDPAGATTSLDFEAASGAEGLYSFENADGRTGLVAWDDADAPGGLGFQGAWSDGVDAFEQVIILAPDAFTSDGGDGAVDGRRDLGTLMLRPL